MTNVCLLGDSISQGVGAVEGRNLPYFLERHLGGKVRLKNYGVSGYTWANIEASVTVESVVAGQNNYVIAFAGTNDLSGGLTPAQTNTARISALADWKTAGFDVILVHMIPRDGYSEANRDTYNGLLDASGESGVVTYVDWPQIESGFADYSSDGIHPNSQGYAIIAQAISQALIELTAPTATSTAAEILALFKADADFGTAGLLADASAANTQTNVNADGYDLEESMRLVLAALVGKATATSTTFTARAADDSKARITATTSADGDRTAVTLDAS